MNDDKESNDLEQNIEKEFLKDFLRKIKSLEDSISKNSEDLEILKQSLQQKEKDEVRILEKLIEDFSNQKNTLADISKALKISVQNFSLIYKRLDNLEKIFK